MYPHRIRLREPWECEPLSDLSGRVSFRRRFNWVSALAPHERVWLTFAGADGSAEVLLNGLLLGRQERAGEPFEFEVTSLLRSRNELNLVVDSKGRQGPHGAKWPLRFGAPPIFETCVGGSRPRMASDASTWPVNWSAPPTVNWKSMRYSTARRSSIQLSPPTRRADRLN